MSERTRHALCFGGQPQDGTSTSTHFLLLSLCSVFACAVREAGEAGEAGDTGRYVGYCSVPGLTLSTINRMVS